MTTTAKFPSALLTLANLGAEFPNFPELVLSGAHNAAVTTITLTTAVPATWPTTGGWVTIDSEIIQYTGVSGSTLTSCTRASQGTTAATHADAAKVGLYLTAATVNQIIADLIAVETQALVGPSPNQVLNSDFSRRTVFGLAMPEVFADTSAWTAVDGSLGSVASNKLTAGSTGTWSAKWTGGDTFYRDARWSAQFQATVNHATKRWALLKYVSGTVGGGNLTAVYAEVASDVFILRKNIAGVESTVTSVANVLTATNFYWLELDAQGTTYTAKLYTSGAAAGTKAAATLLQTLTGTIADASVAAGGVALFSTDTTASVWGGIATGNGGVYVETWLPESNTFAFGGTLGGQAIGYDESTDAGPLNKQWAMRAYIPAASRTITSNVRVQVVDQSVAYAFSAYHKTSGTSASGGLIQRFQPTDSVFSGTGPSTVDATAAQETSWTRKTGTITTAATVRTGLYQVFVNPTTSVTGTFFFMLPQLEQGSAVTAWRNAPADDAPIVWRIRSAGASANQSTTSATTADLDPRDCAANIFLPWDATLDISLSLIHANSGTNDDYFGISMDGSPVNSDLQWIDHEFTAAQNIQMTGVLATSHAAGKTRIAGRFATSAGTCTVLFITRTPDLVIRATRGK